MDISEKLHIVRTSDSPEVLAKLAKDPDEFVRAEVAKNSLTPAQILSDLAKDQDEQIRAKVAENPNISAEILFDLAKDQDSMVRTEAEHSLVRKQAENESAEMSM